MPAWAIRPCNSILGAREGLLGVFHNRNCGHADAETRALHPEAVECRQGLDLLKNTYTHMFISVYCLNKCIHLCTYTYICELHIYIYTCVIYSRYKYICIYKLRIPVSIEVYFKYLVSHRRTGHIKGNDLGSD